MTSIPSLSELIEAGVHLGHHKRRWNPKMKPYIYGIHNGIHIINLEKTIPLLQVALKAIREVAAQKGRILFVGTKRQAQEKISENAIRCGQYYVNHRWLGGMLTNWKTVSLSLRRLRVLEERLQDQEKQLGLTKKELLHLTHERDKLEYTLGGIKDIGDIPDMLFVIDTNKEEIAIQEANKLNIPVVAIVDSNSTPENIMYPIPGNDDSLSAITAYCEIIADAIIEGLQDEIGLPQEDAAPEQPEDASAEKKLKKSFDQAERKTLPSDSAEKKSSPPKTSKPAVSGRPAATKPPRKKTVDPKKAVDLKETADPKKAVDLKETADPKETADLKETADPSADPSPDQA